MIEMDGHQAASQALRFLHETPLIKGRLEMRQVNVQRLRPCGGDIFFSVFQSIRALLGVLVLLL